jgi:nucleoside-triphosphatase
MGQALLLTGRPGVGKTTIIRSVVTRLGARAGGFYTEEVRERGRRTGFRLIALDGPTGMLASVDTRSPYRVGKYRVCLEDLERVGVAALRRAVDQADLSVVVVDEIGKMELTSPAFREAVLAALESPKPVLATVMARPQPWVDAVKARADVSVVEVTLDNRQAMPGRILDWLHGVQRCISDSSAHGPVSGQVSALQATNQKS